MIAENDLPKNCITVKEADLSSSKNCATSVYIINRNDEEFTLELLMSMKAVFSSNTVSSWINPYLNRKTRNENIALDYESLWACYGRNAAITKVNPSFMNDKYYSDMREKKNFSKSSLIILKKDLDVVGGAWMEKPDMKGLSVTQALHIFLDKDYEGKGLAKIIASNAERLLEPETNVITCMWPEQYEKPGHLFKRMNYNVSGNTACKRIR